MSLNVIETFEHVERVVDILALPVLLVSMPVQFDTEIFGGNTIVAGEIGVEDPTVIICTH